MKLPPASAAVGAALLALAPPPTSASGVVSVGAEVTSPPDSGTPPTPNPLPTGTNVVDVGWSSSHFAQILYGPASGVLSVQYTFTRPDDTVRQASEVVFADVEGYYRVSKEYSGTVKLRPTYWYTFTASSDATINGDHKFASHTIRHKVPGESTGGPEL